MAIYKTIKRDGQERQIPFMDKKDALDRTNLYDSSSAIDARDWNTIMALPEEGTLEDLNNLYKEMVAECWTNYPALYHLTKLRTRQPDLNKPLMFCEYGFGHTTYKFLEWCIQNNGYLVTVEMPIAPLTLEDQNLYSELRFYGVDRFYKKYKHCIKLMNHPVAKKRWLWINDDIFKVTDLITKNKEYRNKLFLNGEIDYFYEDAIHDDEFLKQLYIDLKPFLSEQAIFTGDDNTPSIAKNGKL